MIGFMRELNVQDLNAKDVKDHLPMDPTAEAQALADYRPPESACMPPEPSLLPPTPTTTCAASLSI